MRAAMEAGIEIPKLCATDMLEAVRLLPALPGRDRRPRRHAGVLHHAGRRGHGGAHPDASGSKRIRKGVMELYVSDHPLDCLTCAANGDCELQDMAGAVGLREVRYGYAGARHRNPGNDDLQSLFHLRSGQVHRLLALRARLRGGAGHLRADDRRPRLRLDRLGRHGRERSSNPNASPAAPACRPARPATLQREVGDRDRHSPNARWSRPAPIAASAARSRRRCAATKLVRMVPCKDGKANRGHSCVKGRFAWGYATHKERILKPMIRDADHRSVARSVAGTRRSATPPPSSSASRPSTARGSIGGITSSRCTNEETFLVQKLVRAGFGNNNVDTCARVCHSPTGYGLKTTFGTSAGTQDFDSRRAYRRRSWSSAPIRPTAIRCSPRA